MDKSKFHSPRHQQGMSKWGWLLAAALFVGALTTSLSIGPHYIDFQVMQGIMDRLPADRVHKKMTKSAIREHFAKQFRIENFRLKPRDIMTIERDRERTVVSIEYEIREHLAYNVDVVLSFSEQKTFQ